MIARTVFDGLLMNAKLLEETPPVTAPLIGAEQVKDLFAGLRSFGVSVTLVHSGRGVVLKGVARTFYGKQMAQELARKANLVVVANHIRVERIRS
jgi:hypothetical protein